MSYQFNVCDTQEVRNKLTQVFFIVETLNKDITAKIKSKNKFLLMEFVNEFYHVYSTSKNWNEISNKIELPELVKTCLFHEICPETDPVFLDRLFESMFMPFGIKKIDKEKNNYIKTNQVSYNTPLPYYLRQSFSLFALNNTVSFIPSSHWLSMGLDPIYSLPAKSLYTYIDEPFNFIDVIQQFLIIYSDLREDTATHYIQRWIRSQFQISFTSIDTKIIFSDLTKVNSTF